MVTYRKYSHTDTMGYPRLEECAPPVSCGYAQCETGIFPVVLATGPSLERAGGMPVPEEITRIKAPTVPGSPDGLPEEYDLCVQENGMFIRHRDTNHKLHGAHVSAACWTDKNTGIRMCRIDVGGDAEMIVPACIDELVEKEPLPFGCCVNVETSTLICPGSSYDGLVVEIIREYEREEVLEASVAHPDLPGGGARLPTCVKLEPDVEPAPACIDEQTGRLVAPESSILAAYNGQLIPTEYFECEDSPDGGRVCKIKCGVEGNPSDEVEAFLQYMCSITRLQIFPACEVVGERPYVPVPKTPPKYLNPVPVPVPKKTPVPQLCCFNPDTSSLVCEGTPYDGLVVELVTRVVLPNGMEVASVEHPSIPGGGARVPVCRESPPQRRPTPKRPVDGRVVKCLHPSVPRHRLLPENACYNMETGLLEAEGTMWDGVGVQPLSIGAINDGSGNIVVGHPGIIGGRASVPICHWSSYSESPRKYGAAHQGFPNIDSSRQANVAVSPWDYAGHSHPPNITGNSAGYNTELFQCGRDVAGALTRLGYRCDPDSKLEFSSAISRFQGDWNAVSSSVPTNADLQGISWVRVPRGNVAADGLAGHVTQNALEIALVNQEAGLPWEKVLLINQHCHSDDSNQRGAAAVGGVRWTPGVPYPEGKTRCADGVMRNAYGSQCSKCGGNAKSVRRFSGELKDPFKDCYKVINPWTGETKEICKTSGPGTIASEIKDPFKSTQVPRGVASRPVPRRKASGRMKMATRKARR